MEIIKIALIGKMRSGKDTVADYLVKRHQFKNYAFADPIKDIVGNLFPQLTKENGGRKAYQQIGDTFRDLDKDVFIKSLLKRIDIDFNEFLLFGGSLLDYKVVVTDVRFTNELQTMKEKGYTIIYVDAPEDQRLERISSKDAKEIYHISEHLALSGKVKADYYIYNDKDLFNLYAQVDRILESIRS